MRLSHRKVAHTLQEFIYSFVKKLLTAVWFGPLPHPQPLAKRRTAIKEGSHFGVALLVGKAIVVRFPSLTAVRRFARG